MRRHRTSGAVVELPELRLRTLVAIYAAGILNHPSTSRQPFATSPDLERLVPAARPISTHRACRHSTNGSYWCSGSIVAAADPRRGVRPPAVVRREVALTSAGRGLNLA